VIAAALFACVLLMVGAMLRANVRALAMLSIPSSVAGGLIGLALLQGGRAWPRTVPVAEALGAELRQWPAWLIAVVFAGLLLERPRRRIGDAARGALLAGVYAWIVIVGEIALGLFATWLVILPAFDVPPAFGQLLEAGFAGGHGTAAALGAVFEQNLGFPEGRDLGFFVGTVGLLYGIASGIALVNVGVRRSWPRRPPEDGPRRARGRGEPAPDRGTVLARRMPSLRNELRLPALAALCAQAILVATALAAGVGLQRLVAVATIGAGDTSLLSHLGRLPLFIFAMAGGLALRATLVAVGAGDLIDGPRLKRTVAAVMAVLIVAAVAALRIDAVAGYLAPLALLILLGAAWTVFALVVLAPRLLPREHWFELGLLNYGMSTATTAQGMMLLRLVDPDLETRAAEDYALAVPLSAPFIGGGVITFALPLVLTSQALPVVAAIAIAAMALLYVVGRALRG
jgi:ESS family glutamate:Na+ symporter